MKRVIGLSALLVVYAAAIALGIFLYVVLSDVMNDYLAILIADVSATVLVWASGVVLRTASAYDPYWSLQTLVIYLCLLIKSNNWHVGTILLLAAIILYSARLTMNFIIGFHSLGYVDWRYRMLKEKSGKFYQVVNLFGICMFPTLVVYLATLPVIAYASVEAFSAIDIIGLAVIVLGTLLEFIADTQMKAFVKIRKDRSEVLNKGVWKYSRHPNYLGEISIWFGVALTLILSHFNYWYFIVGAVVNLLMFIFISIPMEERHFKDYKPDYEQYKKETHMLLILPKKK